MVKVAASFASDWTRLRMLRFHMVLAILIPVCSSLPRGSLAARQGLNRKENSYRHISAKIVRKPYNFTEDVVVKGISVHNDIYSEVVFMRHILNFLVLPGDGSGTRPARTCRDLMIAHPSYPDGFYYIDPNGGETADKLQAYCNFTGGGWTVLEPQVHRARLAALALQRGLKGYDNYTWYSTMDRHFRIDYPAASQLRLLRAQSRLARQQLTFRCIRTFIYPRSAASVMDANAVQLLGDDNAVLHVIGSKDLDVEALRNDCDERLPKGRCVLQVTASDAKMAHLPITDFALYDVDPRVQMAVVNKATLMFM